ncbi:MAG: hypothetical protein OEW15_15135 [Nitrospirota bacterium]|nr:hypothetical protein [Nitrospirota bacterium]
MKRFVLVLLMLVLPISAYSAGKTHMKTDGQDCVECHGNQEQVWLDGKHGLMNVKCVVCHGNPEQNFAPKPGLSRCRGCHAEKVADVEKKLSAKERTCFLCHDNHRVTVKDTAKVKSGFHQEGGAPK